LDIVAGEGTIQYILPDLVRRFCDAYPDVQIKLRNAAGGELLGYLRDQAVDLGFGSLIRVPADITYEPLLFYRPVLITSTQHPLTRRAKVTLTDVAAYSLIVPPRDIDAWRVIDLEFRKRGLEPKIALEISGWEVIKAFVRQGLGISIVSQLCLGDARDLMCFAMHEYLPARSYGVINVAGKRLPLAARRFVEFARSTAESINKLTQSPAETR